MGGVDVWWIDSWSGGGGAIIGNHQGGTNQATRGTLGGRSTPDHPWCSSQCADAKIVFIMIIPRYL